MVLYLTPLHPDLPLDEYRDMIRFQKKVFFGGVIFVGFFFAFVGYMAYSMNKNMNRTLSAPRNPRMIEMQNEFDAMQAKVEQGQAEHEAEHQAEH